ncbi:LytR family transcriptional attenuator [Solirubrobacter pauli]|uniref:LytR family transcriptional attenuator n=1 Tax=Solirubrobacter pauli TaxID=166793 RepID=A0A660L9M2_9ACTN|nr:LCP family protein [Solirubrobacter pauli]RKQ91718.1 LytR family transcriptional attenuator [Solirubrobacter pauli]
MADPDDKRPYNVYRSKPKLFGRRDDDGGLAEMQQEEAPPSHGWEDAPPPPRRRRRLPFPRRRPGRRRIGFWRILRWVVTAVFAWLAISLVLFLVSAQIQSAQVSDAADAELGGAGYPLTSPNTILVLGSDARTKDSKEPGAQKIGQASRSDSILLLRIGGGHNATLSIPRDTVVDIPGHGRSKINAAYAIGGPALAIRTVEGFLGVQVNHLIEVNFENFPQLIDALGGVTYRGGCVVSRINGGFKNGGYTLRLKSGEQEIDGKQALALARTRKNECNPKESDLTRARRQQKILGAIKDKVTSVETFVRLPWVSWAAPKAVRSDMSGPTLLGVVGAELSAGTAKPQVLKPSGGVTLPDGGAGLTVDDATKQRAVDRFLG